MTTVSDISNFINSIAPYETKCDWDNCGILVGKTNAEVKKIGFCLDLTPETLKNAQENGIDLIVTHHPAIFKAKKSFLESDLVFSAAVKGIGVISAHTCFDCADGGVNDVLCDLLELCEIKKIPNSECVLPMTRMGVLKNEMKDSDFASFVAKKLSTTVRFVSSGKSIKSVAVCGGAGMSFADEVLLAGADAYVTGDISHHEMLDAKEKGLCVVAAGHFETEYPAMNELKKRVDDAFEGVDCVLISQSNPVQFIR